MIRSGDCNFLGNLKPCLEVEGEDLMDLARPTLVNDTSVRVEIRRKNWSPHVTFKVTQGRPNITNRSDVYDFLFVIHIKWNHVVPFPRQTAITVEIAFFPRTHCI